MYFYLAPSLIFLIHATRNKEKTHRGLVHKTRNCMAMWAKRFNPLPPPPPPRGPSLSLSLSLSPELRILEWLGMVLLHSSVPEVFGYEILVENKGAQWPIGYGVGLQIKQSSVRIRPWPLR